MGCYGIGVTRTVIGDHRAIEYRDISGLPPSRRSVCLCPLSVTPGSSVMSLAEKLMPTIAQGVSLLDDRDERRVKFKDADLIGFPCADDREASRRGGRSQSVVA